MTSNEFYDKLKSFLKESTGIIPTGIHEKFIVEFVEQELKKNNKNYEEYLKLIVERTDFFTLLVNTATINETYFFREEKQFRFLRDTVFPSYLAKYGCNKQLVIWSAACSSGEEPLSLYLLSRKSGFKPLVYASDIDSEALKIAEAGVYNSVSMRDDGKEFHTFVQSVSNYNKKDSSFKVNTEVVSKINYSLYNLISDNPLPLGICKADIIFMRNTFIYFDEKTRTQILNKLSTCLNDDGYLFLSMSEISGVKALEGSLLEKQRKNDVFFFRKVNKKQAVIKTSKTNTLNSINNKHVSTSNKLTFTHNKSIVHNSPKQSLNPEKVFEELSVLLNEKKGQRAIEFAESFDGGINRKYLSAYFIGYAYKGAGDIKKAGDAFERAVLINPLFWPGYFQIGLLLQEKQTAKARKAFEKCASLIDNYVEQENTIFDFLMESFSPEYFRDLCLKYLGKGL